MTRLIKVGGKTYRVPSRTQAAKNIETGFATGIPRQLRQAVGYCDGLLYDCSSPVSSATEDTYFQVSVGGQLSGSSTVKKTIMHTNLKQSGQLASDERFEVHGYTMWITPLMMRDTDYATVVTLTNAMLTGYVVIKFRGYRDLDYPISSLISFRPHGQGIVTDYNNWQGAPLNFAKGYKRLTKPIILSRSVPVEVKVEWNAAPESGSTNATLLYFSFVGIREFSVIS